MTFGPGAKYTLIVKDIEVLKEVPKRSLFKLLNTNSDIVSLVVSKGLLVIKQPCGFKLWPLKLKYRITTVKVEDFLIWMNETGQKN